MNCPKCGSPLRASKQKEGYFLCDSCRTRMSLEYINKMASSSEVTAEPEKQSNAPAPKISKKKLIPIFLILLLLLIGCMFLFTYLGVFGKIKATLLAEEKAASFTESVDITILNYEIISDDISPSPSYDHEYLIVNIQITNNSTEDLSVNSMNNFEGYVDNNKISYCADSADVLAALDYTSLNTPLTAGSSVTGHLCFELPNSWNTLDLHYAPTIWTPEEIILTIENTD